MKTCKKGLSLQVSSDQPLLEAGLDSLAAVELRNSLSKDFRLDLPSTAIFDYPTVKALAQYVASQLPDPANTETTAATHQTAVSFEASSRSKCYADV